MTTYQFKAINASGKVVRGTLEAKHLPELEARLHRQKLELITGDRKGRSLFSGWRKKATNRDLINFCFHLEQLTEAGVPLVDALKDLRDSLSESQFRDVVTGLIERIEEGSSFSAALEQYPRLFRRSFVSLIAAGEASGELGAVLQDLFKSLRWQDELKSQTHKAMMYPAFVMTVIVGVVFFLMIYLVPQLIQFLTSMGESIPLQTRALIATSYFFVNYWHVLLFGSVATVLLVRQAAARNERIRHLVDRAKLKVMIFGPILRKIILARFSSHFALLFNAGIPVLECLRIAEGIVNNSVIEQALQDVATQISEGDTITDAFASTGIFPALVVRMAGIGEATGDLGKALDNIAYFYKRDAEESIEKMQTVIEPTITVMLGLLIGWIMLSVLGPVYDLIGKIKT